jgi:hypothetical protein
MKTAVDFMASKLLYLDNEYDMKLINKNEYQAKRKEIIEQAKGMEKTQEAKEYLKGFRDGKEWQRKNEQLTFKSE